MSAAQWQVAQVNIGRARGAIDGPIMAEFVAMLAEINAVAEQTRVRLAAADRGW